MVHMNTTKQGHFPAEFYADLPTWIQMRICRCISKGGWTRDPKTDWWVCDKCMKPSRYSACRKCENCEAWFIPTRFPGTQASDWSDSCSACYPEAEYNQPIEESVQ